MEQISLNFTKIEFKYRSDAKLFGLIPSSLLQDVSLEGGAVNLKKPWYSFLFSGVTDLDDLAAAAQATKDKGHKDEIEILSWSFGASNAGSMSAGSGGGAGKVNIAVGDVNGDGVEDITLAGLATNFAILLDTVKSAHEESGK
ncbi:type VI secretion system tube protein Hcp [Patescibacteria group bacterium]|nr:type VI secretion system tube protein Hcp [Patescibacteria group bacterium]